MKKIDFLGLLHPFYFLGALEFFFFFGGGVFLSYAHLGCVSCNSLSVS
jgi:hypothetical protein